MESRAIFAKFYTLTYSVLKKIPYSMTPLPGYKEGISGSIIAGYNIGIDGSIPKEKLEASIIAFKFLSSKEIQRKYSLIENLVTGVTSLYDDEEICKRINCESMKKVQLVGRPSSNYYQISDYATKIENYIYEYLYGSQTAEKALEKVDDLTRIHYVSLNGNDLISKLAKINFLFVMFLSCLMLGSLLCLNSKKIKPYFSYLPKSSWIISVLGLIVVLSNCYTTLGPVTSEKCHLYVILLVFGYTLNIMPIFHQYIVDLPLEDVVSKWIKENKLYFFISLILFDCLLLSSFSLKVYTVDLVMIAERKIFETCNIRNAIGLLVLIFLMLLFLLVILIMLLISYLEWGHKTLIYDIKIFIIAIYSDAFTILLLFILNFIPFENYILQYLVKNAFTLMSVITSYIFIIGYRIYKSLCKKEVKRKPIITSEFKSTSGLKPPITTFDNSGNVIKTQNMIMIM